MKGEYRQVVKLATPGELRAYVVFEHQLDSLAQGSPVSLLLNFALFFLGVAASALGTLWTAPPANRIALDLNGVPALVLRRASV